MTRLLRNFLMATLFLSMAACKNGCTTASTLDSESVSANINGTEVKMTANLIEYRNSRRDYDQNIFTRDVSYSYAVAFDIETPWFDDEEVAIEGVSDPDNVDLEGALTRFRVELSANKEHFAYGIDDKVLAVYHVIGNRAFTESRSFSLAGATTTWNDLDIDNLAPPREIFSSQFQSTEGCNFASHDQDHIVEIFNDLPADDTLHLVALNAWPNCGIIERFLDDAQVTRLSQDATWREAAIARSIFVLGDDRESFFGTDAAMAMLEKIGDDKAKAALDNLLISYYGHNGHSEANEYIRERLESGTLSQSGRDSLESKVKEAFEPWLENGREDHQCKAEDCFAALVLLGEPGIKDRVREMAFNVDFVNDNFFDVDDVIFGNWDLFTPDEQQQIVSEAKAMFPDLKDYLRENMLESLAPHIDCGEVKAIKDQYPNDMDHLRVDDYCPNI